MEKGEEEKGGGRDGNGGQGGGGEVMWKREKGKAEGEGKVKGQKRGRVFASVKIKSLVRPCSQNDDDDDVITVQLVRLTVYWRVNY